MQIKIALAASLSLCAAQGVNSASAQAILAHCSFDTPTITTGVGGRIETAADETGLHNATSVFAGTGATINSVPGRYGQGAQFTNTIGANATNNAWMSFPQFTEIMGPTADDFAVAAWANAPTGATTDDNPIIADWGNAPAGSNRFTYWFELDNADTNTASRPRAQIRAANAPPSPMTTDIIATTLSAAQAGAANFANGAWHHYAWSWNKAFGQMTYFIDGVQRHVQTSTQTGDNLNLLMSDSQLGALGAKRDNNRYFSGIMDEVWVFDDQLTPQVVACLFQCFSIEGDFNNNGTVDAADYVVWRKGLGTTYLHSDYDIWRAHFGRTGGSGLGASVNTTVPEPATWVMFIVVVAGWCVWRVRAHRNSR